MVDWDSSGPQDQGGRGKGAHIQPHAHRGDGLGSRPAKTASRRTAGPHGNSSEGDVDWHRRLISYSLMYAEGADVSALTTSPSLIDDSQARVDSVAALPGNCASWAKPFQHLPCGPCRAPGDVSFCSSGTPKPSIRTQHPPCGTPKTRLRSCRNVISVSSEGIFVHPVRTTSGCGARWLRQGRFFWTAAHVRRSVRHA